MRNPALNNVPERLKELAAYYNLKATPEEQTDSAINILHLNMEGYRPEIDKQAVLDLSRKIEEISLKSRSGMSNASTCAAFGLLRQPASVTVYITNESAQVFSDNLEKYLAGARIYEFPTAASSQDLQEVELVPEYIRA